MSALGIGILASVIAGVVLALSAGVYRWMRRRSEGQEPAPIVATDAVVNAPNTQGAIEARRDTTISDHAISVDRGGQVTQNIGLVGEDHDRLVRMEKALDEIAQGTAAPGTSPPDTAELAAQATADTEGKLREAVAFVHEGRYKDAIEHVRSAYDRELPPRARAQLYLIEGNAYLLLSEYGAAEAHYKQAIQAAVESHDREAEGYALGSIGLVRADRGDLEGAEEHLRKALDIFEDVGNRLGQASGLGNLGTVYQRLGNWEGAEDHYRKALDIFEELGDRLGQARSLGNLGNVYAERSELAPAEEHYRKALDIHEEIGNRLGQANHLGNLGNVYARLGDLEGAKEHHRKALAIDEEIGYRLGQAQDLANLGAVHASRGDLDAAEERFTSALEIAEEIGARGVVSEIQGLLEELKATDD